MNIYNLSVLYQFIYCFRLKPFKNVQLTYMLSHAHVVPPLYRLPIIAVVIYLTYYHRGGALVNSAKKARASMLQLQHTML